MSAQRHTGRHGIWVTGALRPGVTPQHIRELRGASLSGDWRRIGGSLELVGPGFPVPRADIELTAAGNAPLALVAASGAEPEDISEEAIEAQLDMLAAYVELRVGLPAD